MASGVEARRIAYSLASAQLGVLARRQLVSRELAGNLVDDWLSTGYLLKMLPGVYTLARPADEASSLWMAAVLLGGEGAVLAGTSAAAALGIGMPSKRIEIIRRHGLPRSVRGTRPHHPWTVKLRRGSVRAPEVARVGPIPVLAPSRLLIDLAGRTGKSALRRYFIEAGREGLLTRDCLSEIESRSRDFAGSRALLGLVRNWDPSKGRIRSILEGEFKLLCSEHGLPAPLTNQRIAGYEVDCLWEGSGLVVELDGRKFHDDAAALSKDSAKTRELRARGYRVRRFTWLDVTERPEWVANEIQRELGSVHPGHTGAK